MYARCGVLEEALNVFGDSEHREASSWSTILAGITRNGNNGEAPRLLLEHMRGNGILPHGPMHSNVIAACSRIGKVDEGQQHFASMQESCEIDLAREHLGCFADLLGRSGLLIHAIHVLLALPPPPVNTISSWMSLLAACKAYGNVDLARRCFDEIVSIDDDADDSAAAYMLMSQVYANAQMWEDYRQVQELRKGRCSWKRPGIARIELGTRSLEFVVGQNDFAQFNHLSVFIDRLSDALKEQGYVPCLDVATDPVRSNVKTLVAQECNNRFRDSFPYRRVLYTKLG
jgi:hypothetical protein